MPEYIRLNFQTKKLGLEESCIRIYPIVCWHIGAAQSDYKFIKEHVARIKADPNAVVVYAGDGAECVVVGSKGDVFKQLCAPQQQQDILVDLLEPIKEKLVFGIRGNHGHRVYKLTGMDFDKTLCHRLGIPYLGVAAFCNLVVNRSSYDLYFHHGSDSGTSLRSKIAKAESFDNFIDADAIFTAHSHIAVELHPKALQSCNNDTCQVQTRLRHGYICGSAYDSRTGYAEDKAYSPILPAHISVEFDGRIIEGHARYGQRCEVFRSDGKHELHHDYIMENS